MCRWATLSLQIPGNKDAFTNIQCIVRESGNPHILNVQDFNTDQDYISGNYDLGNSYASKT